MYLNNMVQNISWYVYLCRNIDACLRQFFLNLNQKYYLPLNEKNLKLNQNIKITNLKITLEFPYSSYGSNKY